MNGSNMDGSDMNGSDMNGSGMDASGMDGGATGGSDVRGRRDGRGGRNDAHGNDVVDSATANLLREALSREAARVNPSGVGLQVIRARTTRARRQPAWLLPVAAAAASVAVIGGIGWAAGSGDTGAPFATDAATGGPSIGPDPTDAPSDAPTGPDQPIMTPEGTSVAIPVYYVGEQPADDGGSALEYKLFREYHPITVGAAPDLETRVAIALEEMLANSPLDPDYDDGRWARSTEVRSVDIEEASSVITVDLAGVDSGVSTGADGAQVAAVQQLVFTATAAAAYDGFEPRTVELLVDGVRIEELFGTDVSAPLERDTAGFFAPVQILSFGDGDTLTIPVTVTGQIRYDGPQAVGEPTHRTAGRWQVLSGDSLVADGGFTPETCCGWEPYEFVVDDLPPGAYVLKVFAAAGFEPESAPYDTKNFSIEGPAE